MTEPQLNIPLQFTVPAINPWFETGILLRREHEYTFDVPGKQTWKDGESLGVIPADGIDRWYFKFGMQQSIRMPSEKWYSLLGSIDKNRPYFKIGSHREKFSPSVNGQLVCFANDSLWFGGWFYTHNNSGELKVVITRTR